MVAVAFGITWGGYTLTLWGYCLIKGYDITLVGPGQPGHRVPVAEVSPADPAGSDPAHVQAQGRQQARPPGAHRDVTGGPKPCRGQSFTDGGGPEVAVGWAQQLLGLIGAPKTPGNIEFIYQWERAEGGGGKYNPLNQGPVPGQPNLTTTGQQYGGGAADFASWQAGLLGARDYLNMPAYAGIRNALLANKPAQARTALWQSPWASSHYGYGSRWPGGPVPGGNAVLPPVTGAQLAAAETTSSGGPSSDPAACILAFPNLNPLPIGGSTYQCLFGKSQARALIGGAVILAGGIVAGVGVLIIAATGLKRTGVLGKAADAAAVVPGGQVVAAGLHAAQGQVSATGATRAADRTARRAEQASERAAEAGRQRDRERDERAAAAARGRHAAPRERNPRGGQGRHAGG